MGQTLTHGIYLPDEGERNCYNGLAANWSILDGAIGTIAEHTTALAGKAPLVHTHTKSDITDFPAYGTTAGTICEGNDSRLSDARTPVAHTHVTSEVLKTGSARTASPQTNFYFKIASWEMGANQYFGAELLVQNSNYTQNRVNITIGVRTSSDYSFQAGYLYLSNDLGFNLNQFYICYKEESNKVLFELYHYIPSTWNGTKFSVISECLNKGSFVIELFNTMTVYNRISSDAVADLPTGYTAIEAKYLPLSQDINPASNNTYNFGTSTYQWNNLYAKNYYYNGVAWGLDKANTWTGSNSYTGIVLLNSSSDVAEQFKQKLPKDVSTSNDAMARVNALIDSAGHYVVVETLGHWSNYVAKNITLKYKNDSTKQGAVEFRLYSDGSGIFYPQSPFGCDLGNIYNKWKSFNGINPGALSIFNPSATQDPIDVPNTWVTDGSAWNTLNVSNMGDGWICLTYKLCGTNDYILARFGGTSANAYPSMLFPATKLQDSVKYYLYVLMPVAKAMGNIYLEINLDSNAVLVKHSFIPAYGTV